MHTGLPTLFLGAVLLGGCGGPSPDRPQGPTQPAGPVHTGTLDDTASAEDTAAAGTDGTHPGHAARAVRFSEDLARTDNNPMRGFFTAYAWGDPVTDHPASLEFAYVPLAALMDGPGSFTLDAGLEPLLVAAEARGHQLVFRPYIDYPGLPPGLPDFLQAQVAQRPYTEHGGGQSPDYEDPDLQAALLDFVAALGARYDGDPRLAVVQLGLLGFWGEWHTWPHSDWFADPLFQREVMQAYESAFSTTLLQVRYASDDATARRLGYHDDSFAHSTLGDVEWFFVPQLEAAGATDRWQDVPIGGELRPELQTEIFEPGYTTGTHRQDFAACVAATHASFLLNHAAFGHAFDSEEEAQNTRSAARMLGYALHLTEANLAAETVTLTVDNRGVAPFYQPLRVRVTDAAGAWEEAPLPTLLPSTTPQTIQLDVTSLDSPTLTAPWTVSLASDQILPSQTVRFATAPGEDAIRVE